MGIITAAVFASTYWNGVGFFKFDVIPFKAKEALKAVTKRQRHKFKRYGIIPLPVLEALWHMGLLPGEELPTNGMKLSSLIEFLRQGEYRDQQHRETAKWLYSEIINKEMYASGGKRRPKKHRIQIGIDLDS